MAERGRYFQEVVTAASDYRSEAAASSRYNTEHGTPLAFAFSSSPSQHLYPHAQGPSVANASTHHHAHAYRQPHPHVYGPGPTGGDRDVGRPRPPPPLLQPLPLPRRPSQQRHLPQTQPHAATQPQAHVYGSRPLAPPQRQSQGPVSAPRPKDESRRGRSSAARPARRAPGGFDSEDDEGPPGSPRAASGAERNGWDDGGWLPFGAVLSPQAGPQKLRTSSGGWRLRGWEVIFWHVLLLLAAVASLAALALPDWLLTDASNTAEVMENTAWSSMGIWTRCEQMGPLQSSQAVVVNGRDDCMVYGGNLEAWPVKGWRAAAILFAIATGMVVLSWLLSFIACMATARVLRRILRIAITVAAVIMLTAVLAFFGTLADTATAYNAGGQPLCPDADIFDPGSCELGPGSVFAVIAVGITMIAAVVGWLLPASGPGRRGQRRVRLKKIAQLSSRDTKEQQAETRRQRREEARVEAERRRLAALSAADALSEDEDAEQREVLVAAPRRPPPQTAASPRGAQQVRKKARGKTGKKANKKRAAARDTASAPSNSDAATVSPATAAGEAGERTRQQRRRRRQKPMRTRWEERMLEEMDVADSPWDDDEMGSAADAAFPPSQAAQLRSQQDLNGQPASGGNMWWDVAGQQLTDHEGNGIGDARGRNGSHMPNHGMAHIPAPAVAESSISGSTRADSMWIPAPPPTNRLAGLVNSRLSSPSKRSVQYEAIDDVLETIALEEDREAEALFLAGQRRSSVAMPVSAAGQVRPDAREDSDEFALRRGSSVRVMAPRHHNHDGGSLERNAAGSRGVPLSAGALQLPTSLSVHYEPGGRQGHAYGAPLATPHIIASENSDIMMRQLDLGTHGDVSDEWHIPEERV